jgi:RNA polymerase sigma-70 factor (TIGR02957 family)
MPAESPAADLDDAATQFAAVRGRLFGIAYRMLGSATEAEDVLQETWLRWQGYDRSAVRDSAAFLATTTTRLAINVATSARARRETYVGPWLPEPVDTSADPALGAERAEALELAVLVLLEKLTPTERAAYVLREAFGYPYREIADILGLQEAASRQLVTRARKHLREERRASVTSLEQRRLLKAFLAAARSGDVAALEELFAADVVSYSDGGGVVRASRVPVVGRTKVARFVAAFASRFWSEVTVTWAEANGQPAILLTRDGVLSGVLTLSGTDSGIDQLMWHLNPGKLTGMATTPTAQ